MNRSWIRQLLTMKTLWISANIAFTAFLTVQLAYVLEGYVKPETTWTWDEHEQLEELEFPLVIKICVIPGFNQTALRELGYKETFSYFLGRDIYNNYNATYSWAGHTKGSGRPITVEEVLAKVSGHQFEKIIKSVIVWNIKEHNFINIPLHNAPAVN